VYHDVKLKISSYNPWHSEFLSSLKEHKDNRSAQPCTTKKIVGTKNIEAQVDQNASSKHDFVAQIDSNEKVVKLPNGFRTVWKDQSYCYATGKFRPIGLCTNEKPGRNNIPSYIWYVTSKWNSNVKVKCKIEYSIEGDLYGPISLLLPHAEHKWFDLGTH